MATGRQIKLIKDTVGNIERFKTRQAKIRRQQGLPEEEWVIVTTVKGKVLKTRQQEIFEQIRNQRNLLNQIMQNREIEQRLQEYQERAHQRILEEQERLQTIQNEEDYAREQADAFNFLDMYEIYTFNFDENADEFENIGKERFLRAFIDNIQVNPGQNIFVQNQWFSLRIK